MNILVTGGAGYIGSHTLIELLNTNHNVIVVDNLSNSSEESIKRVEFLTGKKISFLKIDIRNKKELLSILTKTKIDCCVHFAGFKSVNESVDKPINYYNNNVIGILTLLEVLDECNCKNIIFSSSATVYGTSTKNPITENSDKGKCINPYGWSKWMIEQILCDLYNSDKSWNIVILRYFNPVGAHPSGLIGESPNNIPANLMPFITQVAIGNFKELCIFGNDYNTHDGTCIRDYIHVVDLAKGHVASLKIITEKLGLKIYNLGTGKGTSVLEMINTFEKVNKVKIPYIIKERRKGDVVECYADPTKAWKELNWKALYTLEDMCRHSWNWQKNNPNGFHSN